MLNHQYIVGVNPQTTVNTLVNFVPITMNICPECSRWRTVRRVSFRLPFIRVGRERGWRLTLILRPHDKKL